MNNNDIVSNIIQNSDYNSSLKLLSVTNPSFITFYKNLLELKEKETCKFCDAINLCSTIEHEHEFGCIKCPTHGYTSNVCIKYNGGKHILCENCGYEICTGCSSAIYFQNKHRCERCFVYTLHI